MFNLSKSLYFILVIGFLYALILKTILNLFFYYFCGVSITRNFGGSIYFCYLQLHFDLHWECDYQNVEYC